MKFTTKLATAGLATALMASTALAGGYNRGSANLDGLFGDEFGINSGVTYVSPGRSYDSIQGVVLTDNPAWDPLAAPGPGNSPVGGIGFSQGNTEFGQDFTVPYFSIGGRIADGFNCVGSYAQPYGAHSKYSGAFTYHIEETKLESTELGLTCAASFDLSKGSAMVFGGLFHESVDFYQSRVFPANMLIASTGGAVTGGASTIDVSSTDLGYRFGIGYEIPEIALKATLAYRSRTEHDLTGTFGNTPFAAIFSGRGDLANAVAAAGITSAGAYGTAVLPENVELKFQSGIAPGWLAFGSIKWTNWSVVEEVNLNDTISNAEFTDVKAYFKDGWTVSAGLGHKLDDQWSVAGSLTWDRGVTSGWDTFTDTWSFSGGASYKASENLDFRAGGALIYLTEGVKSNTDGAISYTATSPNEWGYALNVSANLKF